MVVKKQRASGWIDIADTLNHNAMMTFKTGQVLVFEKDGVKTAYKIVRKTPYKVWVKETRLYTMEELEAAAKK